MENIPTEKILKSLVAIPIFIGVCLVVYNFGAALWSFVYAILVFIIRIVILFLAFAGVNLTT